MPRCLLLFISLTALTLMGCAAKAGETDTMPANIRAVASQLGEAGLNDQIGLKFTEDLTTEIGPRLAGSDDEKRARDWAVAELKRLGFQNVRTEAFTLPYWSRISESAEIVGPNAQNLVITALGGSQPTPAEGLEADVVRFENLTALEASNDGNIAGKIIFIDEHMTRTQDGSGYGVAVGKRGHCARIATERGAAACLIRSVGTQHHRMPHTGGMRRDPGEPLGAGIAAALSPPDADQIARLIARGKTVRVKLNIQVEAFKDAPSANVIAEVEGGAKKDEIVLISCHLDSWDLGTGAVDDGAGCGIIVGAAKLIDALPGRPARTIRVVLYGSEEVGLFGGKAYAEAHAGELASHILAAESDFGAGRIWQFQTRFGSGAAAYAEEMHKVLAVLGVGPGNNEAHGGPDIGVLARAGVPVVTPKQDGTDYFDLHHTPDDTFDKINPDDFRQNVAVYAVFTYLAAETGWDFRSQDENAPEPAGSQ